MADRFSLFAILLDFEIYEEDVHCSKLSKSAIKFYIMFKGYNIEQFFRKCYDIFYIFCSCV